MTNDELPPCPFCGGPSHTEANSAVKGGRVVVHDGEPHCPVRNGYFTIEQWAGRRPIATPSDDGPKAAETPVAANGEAIERLRAELWMLGRDGTVILNSTSQFVDDLRTLLAMSSKADVVALVRLITDSDHERLCEGRQYTCTCGYDDGVQNAAARLASLTMESGGERSVD